MVVYTSVKESVAQVIDRVGKKIVLATPLGLGKPVQFLNALYQRVKSDNQLSLTIVTALSLYRPEPKNPLVKNVLEDFIARVYGDYQDLDYERDRRAGRLANNVRVIEFFLASGAYVNNPSAQMNFVCSNYTHAVRDSAAFGINVVAQMVAANEHNSRFSLSSNADLAKSLWETKKSALVVGQVNDKLPYMPGTEAEVEAQKFDIIIKNPEINKTLFSIPKQPISDQDYLIGFHASTLIKDDGSLQIGIGTISDALIYCLLLRHNDNDVYRDMCRAVSAHNASCEPFHVGLCAPTEMLVDGYLDLYRGGVLKKILRDEEGDYLAHAGFFVGSNNFYESLRQMPLKERALFRMGSITHINQLNKSKEHMVTRLKNARFLNTCMKATLLGGAASDALESGETISGVGGQYNFVSMAHEVPGARSILMCRASRESGSNLASNIVFQSKALTIPRHLRDMVVTEYGVADIRGKTDREVVEAMLAIADSRFQDGLLKEAKRAKKIEADYRIPEHARNNYPQAISKRLSEFKARQFFPTYPFGSELSDSEDHLIGALKSIEKMSVLEKAKAGMRGMFLRPSLEQEEMLALAKRQSPRNVKEKLERALLLAGLESLRK